MSDSQSMPEISIVVPVFNERDNLSPLLDEIVRGMGGLRRPYEVVFVDDCSTDDSLAVLRRLRDGNRCVRVLRHSLNSGESAASATGLERARGEVVITMDADRQNDPADIPKLLAALAEDDAVAAVCGVRARREDDWVKRVSSRIANRFRNLVTGDRISDAGCTYRALRRECLGELPVFNGLHRFLPTILRLQGYRVIEIKVNHRPRVAGVSKYGIGNRAWRGIVDCLAMRWFRRRAVSGRRFAGECSQEGNHGRDEVSGAQAGSPAEVDGGSRS